MSIVNHLPCWTTPYKEADIAIHTYSTVGDILAYQRCRRQYGFFSVRKYNSPAATQRYFGTLMHDVLDQINRDFQVTGNLPNQQGVYDMVLVAHNRLIRSGVRTFNAGFQRRRAALLIYRFIQLFGIPFFSNIQQTEYRLNRALVTHTGRDYILEGIVDVLSGAVSHALRLPYSTEPDDVEIWDYKSGQVPEQGSRELESYKYQMRVYAELYRQQTGQYPARAVLIFLGELADDPRWNLANGDPSMFPRLVLPVEPHPGRIAVAIQNFNQTVEEIEQERILPYAQQWQAPSHAVDEQTCRTCELHYNCDRYPQGRNERSIPL
ncbi:PD-(D/E)XK nuclease family protein [Spirosoma spitsbergense]|uniref:PD-(D/E)XK nuclease family protein n=1 Tax=Spirosoma spitsbergense TaxID=431554 RepID=UPI0003676AA4|nr:PD-(D/E)XK nuclease family protein [Spirosoma spitsbergense]